jgi:hypothetical protein
MLQMWYLLLSYREDSATNSIIMVAKRQAII